LAYVPVSGVFYPDPPPLTTGATTSSVIDATGEKIAWIGRVWNKDRASKSIRKVGFRFGTVTKAGGSGLTVSLQNVDTANGPPFQPDGTQDQTVAIANGDAGFASNSWYQTGALSADRSVSFGELIAVVVEYDGSGRLGADAVNFTNPAASISPALQGVSLLTASWAAVAVLPSIILEFSDGTFGTVESALPTSTGLSTVNVNSGSTPDEYAIEFQVPAAMKVDGGWFNATAAAGADFDITLYDAGGSSLASVSVDANTVRSTSVSTTIVTFAEVTLAKNTTYRLAIKPTTANNITVVQFDVASADHKQALPGGTSWNYTTRTDAGAWAAATTTRSLIGGLRISAIDDGTGSGSGGGSRARIFGGF
jgi:hypothetical protein